MLGNCCSLLCSLVSHTLPIALHSVDAVSDAAADDLTQGFSSTARSSPSSRSS